MVLVELNF